MSVVPSDQPSGELSQSGIAEAPDEGAETSEATETIEAVETIQATEASEATGSIEATEAATPDDISEESKAKEEPAASASPPAPPPGRRRPRSTRRRVVMVAILLLGVLLPVGVAVGYGVNAYSTYNTLKGQAYDGVQHLLNVKTVFTGLKAHPSGFFDAGKLESAQQQLAAARQDFTELSYEIDHTPIIQTITTYLPQYRAQVQAARAASHIGVDVAQAGQELVATAMLLAPSFSGQVLADASRPLITQSTLNLVGSTVAELMPQLTDIQQQARLMPLASLPVSSAQRSEIGQLLQALPQAQNDLQEGLNLLGAIGWLLGVDAPRAFLVQTMDRSEIRGTGGFTGQYGELTINGGRVAPFALRDISLVEYTASNKTLGQPAPAQYQSWWPFANFGLRDSNISADFPTSARLAIAQYQNEVGRSVEGVIVFTPFLIEHVLQIVGPVYIPGYNETITAQNLEDRLHYYQQDNAGIAKQIALQPGNTSTSARKRFTSQLASDLLAKVRQAPPDELIAIASEMLHDLKTKDLQVYFTNPQIEALLAQYGDAAQLDRSTSHDGLYVVQQNLSASKASQYVQTIMKDTVTLDANGGATHLLQMRLVYNQIGPVYGYDTYRDYVRIYVPPTARLLYGDGFDSGTPLCGGPYAACPANGIYPGGELTCPTGLYQAGAHPPYITAPDGGSAGPLDTIGPPNNLQSDEAGRAMFGGWVILPKNCTMTVTLSWYVPPVGNAPYTLLVQRQAGLFPELDLTILPTPGDCAALHLAPYHFDGLMGEDMSFTPPASKAGADGCYPQPGI
ncbi:MAG TPA: DUF4012 domain-containing protein [Ktedonobacteraceae bacterium]|nr:DUF4012 domain-containing protein [Ktedonobacteraceae bacterium]